MRRRVRLHPARPLEGIGKREIVRRLVSLGLSTHNEPETRNKALAIVARFLAWCHRQPCALTGYRPGQWVEYDPGWKERVEIDPEHWETRGGFGADLGNVFPCSRRAHDELHSGQRTLEGWEAALLGRNAALAFLTSHEDDARWLLAHTNDGDVLTLCQAALAAPGPTRAEEA